MTNYLLSIDPSIKNTGITFWQNKVPILIKSYSFNGKIDFRKYIVEDIDYYIMIESLYIYNKDIEDYIYQENNYNLDLIIERGTFHSKNGIGYETQEHLRGFIAGQFNKLLTKNMLISPSEWKKYYWIKLDLPYHKELKKINEWNKNLSLEIANNLIEENNWNITISNHDEADSLLIGWYYLNKEKK
ncbi:hypothetical protein [Spiroplasma endosymbiont of Apeira syringaria]|uniref:hypothetical protein n=1 Tax=Spiroplasma endosymbiont of Apeira syringaria TaxID=3066307 RepID=UPI0030CF9E19